MRQRSRIHLRRAWKWNEAAMTLRTIAAASELLRTQQLSPRDLLRECLEKIAALNSGLNAFVTVTRDRAFEDAAQAVDARYKGRHLGTIGDIGCFSFHSTKNITCGEGGAFLTNDAKIAERADVMREKGTNRHAFLRGEIDRYSWIDSGSSYVLSDLLAALLRSQLANRATIKSLRKRIWHRYLDALRPLRDKHGLTLPSIPTGADPNYHLFPFLVSGHQRRNEVLDCLHQDGIGATFHYVPLHSAPCMVKRGGTVDNLPVTTMVSERLIRLPLFPGLRDGDVERVIASVVRALGR